MVLESKYGSPKIVNDGVTIAREVELDDPVENIGCKLVRQVRARASRMPRGASAAVPRPVLPQRVHTLPHTLCALHPCTGRRPHQRHRW